MKRELAKAILIGDTLGTRVEKYEAIEMALKDMQKVEKIKEIINSTQEWIQEDVIRYKMICEVLEND